MFRAPHAALRRAAPTVLLVALAFAPGLNAQRLSDAVVPRHYALALTPDLAAERFTGQARIHVRVNEPTSRFVLHAAGLDITTAAIDAGGVPRQARVSTNAAQETIALELDTPVEPGEATLSLAYAGRLNRQLRGFYLSEANDRKYAVTQLQATDARRMFPSFDEPRFKATFDIQATVPEGDLAISNGPVERITDGPAPGTRTFDFATTKPMPTYLVALAVGDFECVERRMGEVPLRICATPGNAHLTGFAMEATQASLAYQNAYFQAAYPFQKLDLVAIPDFAAGAMENTGAVFFRESLLLVDDDAALAVRKRVATVIAHELAHMWFGNLVTMAWWDDLWLNEGFATWMATKTIADWQPSWDMELDELLATYAVMSMDARRATRPIRTRVTTPAEIESLFDPIAYDKTAALLGMIETFVGQDAWRRGINAYLEAHAFGNATAEDFWTRMTRVTGRPVDRIMQGFVDRAGVPVVSVETTCENGHLEVALSQQRFSSAGASASEPWAIPVCLDTRGAPGGSGECHLLDTPARTLTLDGCSRWVVGNRGAEGYYRTHHGPEALSRLITANAELAADERLMLAADEWALMRAGVTNLESFLRVTVALADDAREPAVIRALGARLRFVHEYLTTPQTRPAFERWVRDQFGAALRASRRAVPDSDVERERRAALVGLVGAVGRDAELIDEARADVQEHLAGRAGFLQGDLLDAYVGVAAIEGGEALHTQYRQRAEKADTPEERYRFLYGLTLFRDPALVGRTLDYVMSDRVRAQDRALLLARLMANPAAREETWQRIRDQWTTIQEEVGAFGGSRRIIASLGAFCDRERLEQIRSFFDTHQVPGAGRTLAQALEDVESCAALAESQRRELSEALATRR